MQSPFFTHRDKALGYYGAASCLRQLVLAMWNGKSYPIGLSQFRELDRHHADAVFEMLTAYRKHGENDRAFISLAEECRVRLEQERAAAKRADDLDRWMSETRNALRHLGLNSDLTESRESWFEKHFDEGMQPSEAANQAGREKLAAFPHPF